MASISEICTQLKLPLQFEELFSELEYTEESLLILTKDQLEEDLRKVEFVCNVEELFQRIISWRKSKGVDLFTFEVIDFYIDSEQEDSVSETLRSDSGSDQHATVVSATLGGAGSDQHATVLTATPGGAGSTDSIPGSSSSVQTTQGLASGQHAAVPTVTLGGASSPILLNETSSSLQTSQGPVSTQQPAVVTTTVSDAESPILFPGLSSNATSTPGGAESVISFPGPGTSATPALGGAGSFIPFLGLGSSVQTTQGLASGQNAAVPTVTLGGTSSPILLNGTNSSLQTSQGPVSTQKPAVVTTTLGGAGRPIVFPGLSSSATATPGGAGIFFSFPGLNSSATATLGGAGSFIPFLAPGSSVQTTQGLASGQHAAVPTVTLGGTSSPILLNGTNSSLQTSQGPVSTQKPAVVTTTLGGAGRPIVFPGLSSSATATPGGAGSFFSFPGLNSSATATLGGAGSFIPFLAPGSSVQTTQGLASGQHAAVPTVTLGGTSSPILFNGTSSSVQTSQGCALPGTNDSFVVGLFGPRQLEDLLRQTETGITLIQRASRAALTNQSQSELVDIIAEYHISQGHKATEEICRQYASAVVLLFPKEELDSYFTKRGGGKRNPGGRIYNRIHNSKQLKRKREQLEENHVSQENHSPNVDPACEEAVEWLRLNVNPWSVTLDKWKASFAHRCKHLQNPKRARECFEEHRHYAEPYGYQLIDIDYGLLYNHEYEGVTNWNSFMTKLIPHVALKSRDARSNELVNFLRSQTSDTFPENNKDQVACAVLILLNNILKPTRVNKTFLPSVQVAQEDTILFVDSREDIPQRINKVYSMYATFDSPPIPKLVFTGHDAVNLSGDFFVCYHSAVYQVESVERAVDVVIKLTQVFGLEFSKLNRKLWIFLGRHLFKLNHLAEYTSVNELIRKLN